MITILGAGLTGISASYHLGHQHCIVYEKSNYIGGHIHSYQKDNCIWDEGPHVSFTKYEYVKSLFAANTNGEFHEFAAEVSNYYHGSWIPHPAQNHLICMPPDIREKCWNDFIESRATGLNDLVPENYEQWLLAAFGRSFYENFVNAYTKKYWTTGAEQLTTDWVGERVYYPSIEDVTKGYEGRQDRNTHYITSFRYPKTGGYFGFAATLAKGMNVQLGKELDQISFANRRLFFTDGTKVDFQKLISTIPLPHLILKSEAPEDVKDAAHQLSCTELLLVNVLVAHKQDRADHWLYVYDEEKYCTRISFLEKLSVTNAPEGYSAIQVEVYFSKYRPFTGNSDEVAATVVTELQEMGLIKEKALVSAVHTKWVPFANVLFDKNRRAALSMIFEWLGKFGYVSNENELHPMTDWSNVDKDSFGDIMLAGRFGEWKYYWTDDCILTTKRIAESILRK